MTELKKATKTIKSRVATFALQIVKTQLSCTLPTEIGIMYNDIGATLLDCLRKVKINFILISIRFHSIESIRCKSATINEGEG
jgi:hypothetical protein